MLIYLYYVYYLCYVLTELSKCSLNLCSGDLSFFALINIYSFSISGQHLKMLLFFNKFKTNMYIKNNQFVTLLNLLKMVQRNFTFCYSKVISSNYMRIRLTHFDELFTLFLYTELSCIKISFYRNNFSIKSMPRKPEPPVIKTLHPAKNWGISLGPLMESGKSDISNMSSR